MKFDAIPRLLHQLDVDNAGAVDAPRPAAEEATGDVPTGPVAADSALLEILAGLSGAGGQEEPKQSKEDYLGQLFGGAVWAGGASDDFAMEGLGRTGSSLTTLIRQVSRMTEAELSYLQRRLFQAGFYEGTVYANSANINWGQVDELTATALETAFEQAAANQVENFDQFLAAEGARFRRDGVAADGSDVGAAYRGETGEDRPVIDILLEDPDAIKLVAESMGTELLGRKPTEAELSKITARIHSEQTRVAKERAAMLEAGRPTGPDFAEERGLLGADMAIPGDYTPNANVKLSGEQYANAQTIIAVGQEMGLSEEYIVGALSAAIVESGLKNINYGDRDSVGLFQQRTSQGWGTIEQIMDPRYSARKFYEAMLRADGDTLGERVANTQRPAKQYRGRYGEQMNTAAGILQLLGRTTLPLGPEERRAAAAGRLAPTNAEQQIRGGSAPQVPMGPEERRAAAQGRLGTPNSSRGAGLPGAWGALSEAVANAASPVLSGGGVERGDDEQPFWLGSMVGNSESDPIFNTVMGVDVNASIAEELKRSDPVAYQTRQAALKAYEFFAMLGAGGGLV